MMMSLLYVHYSGWMFIGNLVYSILVVLIFGSLFTVILSKFTYWEYASEEASKRIYPQDYKEFEERRLKEDNVTTIRQWKNDRYAYDVWTWLQLTKRNFGWEPYSDLPFPEWVEKLHPEKRRIWRNTNSSISPGYPGDSSQPSRFLAHSVIEINGKIRFKDPETGEFY